MVLARRGDPEALARKVLEKCCYLDTYRQRPRLDLATLLQLFGLTWHHRDLAGLAGALVRFEACYYVVTDSRQGWVRQRFTAAHELKHYLTDRHLAPVFVCRRHVDTVKWLWEKGFYAPEEIGRCSG